MPIGLYSAIVDLSIQSESLISSRWYLPDLSERKKSISASRRKFTKENLNQESRDTAGARRIFAADIRIPVITITNYDLFGKDYMMYTVHNKCEEIPDMEYDDGLKFLYFYTKGKKGGSQAIKNMLIYIQNSESKNAVDEATKKIDFYVSRVKNLPEVEAGYMTLGDWIDSIKEDMAEEIREEIKEEVREEVKKEVREEITESLTKEVTDEVTEKVTSEVIEQNIKIMVGVFQEYHDTKENAAAKLRCKFPEYAQQAEELIEKYWEEG